MNIIIRPAVVEDFAILKSFEQGIVEYERPYGDTLKEKEVSYYDLEALIASALAYVIVACDDEVIVGSGYAHIVPSKDYYIHAQHAHLGFMYVMPDYRGHGINKMIIDELLKWVKAQGVTEARLEVYAVNDSAVRAYSKIGFTPNLLEMRMKVE